MKEIFVLLDRCTGCHSCELACAVAHSQSKDLFAAIFETPLPKRRLFVEAVDGRGIPVLCRHCEEAPCLYGCPAGALYRDERGAVRSKAERCIGCWTCIMLCPYGVVGQQLDGRAIAVKCDLCPDREVPACVEACPEKALMYMDPAEFSRWQREQALRVIAGGNP